MGISTVLLERLASSVAGILANHVYEGLAFNQGFRNLVVETCVVSFAPLVVRIYFQAILVDPRRMVAFVNAHVALVLMDSYLVQGMLGTMENSTVRTSHIVIVADDDSTISAQMAGFHLEKEGMGTTSRIWERVIWTCIIPDRKEVAYQDVTPLEAVWLDVVVKQRILLWVENERNITKVLYHTHEGIYVKLQKVTKGLR